MKKIAQKLTTILMISILAVIANAAIKDKRITLRNGKAKENVTLNPSRTYKFVINGKEFKKLSMALQIKGGDIQVEIKSPSGKTLSSGVGKSFSIKSVEEGDYTITLRNRDKSEAAAGYIKIGDIEGESQ
jgi:hypothetical protein